MSGDNCRACVEGTYSIGESCDSCSSGCAKCTRYSQCDSCYPGYFLSGDRCRSCEVLNCADCSSASGGCAKCKAGYGLVEKSCEMCQGFCTACDSKTPTVFPKCTVCNAGFQLDENSHCFPASPPKGAVDIRFIITGVIAGLITLWIVTYCCIRLTRQAGDSDHQGVPTYSARHYSSSRSKDNHERRRKLFPNRAWPRWPERLPGWPERLPGRRAIRNRRPSTRADQPGCR